MRRTNLLVAGAVFGSVGLCASACSSDERSDFLAPAAVDGGDEVGAGTYLDATVAGDPCDPKALVQQQSIAGCRFFLTASTWFPDALARGCYVFVVTNASAKPAHW